MDQQNHQYYLEPFLIKELIFLKLIRLTDYKIQWIKNNKKWMIFLTCGIWIESGFLCGECMNLPCYCNTKFYWTCKESFKWTFPTLIWFKLFFMTVVIAHGFLRIFAIAVVIWVWIAVAIISLSWGRLRNSHSISQHEAQH